MSRENELTLQELLELGDLGLEMGYWSQAEAYYRRALDMAPEHPQALLGLARACHDPGRAMEAVQALLAVCPDSPEGQRLEAELLKRIPPPDPPREPQYGEWQAAPRAPATALMISGVAILFILALVLLSGAASWRARRMETAAEPTILAEQPTITHGPTAVANVAELVIERQPLDPALAATVLVVAPDITGARAQQGSGVVVDERGFVLTNHHVLADSWQALMNPDGLAFVGFASDVRRPPDEWYIAAAVALDPGRDLAVLRILATAEGRSIQGRLFQPAPLRLGDELGLGEGLVGLGYPALGGETLTLTRGSMAGYAYSATGVRLGKTDSELLPGSSGGAVLDAQGRLAGVITATMTEPRTQGRLSYFVLIQEATELLARAWQAPYPGPSLRWMRDLFQEWREAR